MPFDINTGRLPSVISDNSVNPATCPDIPPDMKTWEKMKECFSHTQQPEALACIRTIYNLSPGTTREDVLNRFEQLRRLAHPGYQENIQSGRHGNNHACILDTRSHEILSVTFDDIGSCILECEGVRKTYPLATTQPQIAEVSPKTAENYEAIWSAWRRDAPPEEIHIRSEVVAKMCSFLRDNHTWFELIVPGLTTLPDHLPPNILELRIKCRKLTSLPVLPSGLQNLGLYHTPLSSLPELPPGLQNLELYQTPLSSLPELPPGLQNLELYHTLLTSLPELPRGLRKLELEYTPLSSLPELPSGLQRLSLSDTLLSSLPVLPSGLQNLSMFRTLLTSLPVLPSGLRSLDVFSTPLSNLPELPSGLECLNAFDTRLSSLPELPPGLQRLSLSHSPLSSLPELPSGLQRLSVCLAPLSSLPESIARLSSQAYVDLQNVQLTERTLQALRNMIVADDYSGPRIFFDMSNPLFPRQTRPLHLVIADWLTPDNAGQQPSSGRWLDFGRQDNAASFSQFLDRLGETENARKNPSFKTQIAAWLTDLTCDDELRAKTFAMAAEASSSCEDRVTLALNHMQNVQLVHRAEKGEFDNNYSGMVAVAREMFRLEILEQIARKKADTLRFIDEIEVYLAYQNKLKERLELSSITKEMRYFYTANITDSELKSAETQVKTAEDSQFIEWILQWAPLHGLLKRTNPALWQTLSEQKVADYNGIYSMLSDSELKPAGLLDSDDAVRAVGVRSMESAEKAFLKRLGPVVNQMLGGHLNARWLQLSEPMKARVSVD